MTRRVERHISEPTGGSEGRWPATARLVFGASIPGIAAGLLWLMVSNRTLDAVGVGDVGDPLRAGLWLGGILGMVIAPISTAVVAILAVIASFDPHLRPEGKLGIWTAVALADRRPLHRGARPAGAGLFHLVTGGAT